MRLQSSVPLAHALFPQFPPIAVVVLIVLVVGGLLAAAAAKWRAGAAESVDGASPWRVPVFAFIACALAVPLSFVPLLGLLGNVVLMPGYAIFLILVFRDVLPEHVGPGIAVMVGVAFSWAFWTAVGLIVSKTVARFRGPGPKDSGASGSGSLSIR